MSFKRRVENFVCEKCETEVEGNGYTNHCPNCLTSKHVDLDFPGDRLASCHGLMTPIGVKLVGGQPVKILFSCQKCHKEILNQIAEQDNKEIIVNLPVIM